MYAHEISEFCLHQPNLGKGFLDFMIFRSRHILIYQSNVKFCLSRKAFISHHSTPNKLKSLMLNRGVHLTFDRQKGI